MELKKNYMLHITSSKRSKEPKSTIKAGEILSCAQQSHTYKSVMTQDCTPSTTPTVVKSSDTSPSSALSTYAEHSTPSASIQVTRHSTAQIETSRNFWLTAANQAPLSDEAYLCKAIQTYPAYS